LHPKSSTFPPTSRAAIELDIHVSAILNRHLISPRPLHHDFTELRLGIPSNTKLVGSLEGLWEDERRRRREAGRDNNLEAKPSQEERVGFEGGQFPGKGVGWNTEQRWWEEVGERFKSDSKLRKSAGKIGKIGFEEFIRSAGGLMQEDREAWDKVISKPVRSCTFIDQGLMSEPTPCSTSRRHSKLFLEAGRLSLFPHADPTHPKPLSNLAVRLSHHRPSPLRLPSRTQTSS
jgi:hypothetical protein